MRGAIAAFGNGCAKSLRHDQFPFNRAIRPGQKPGAMMLLTAAGFFICCFVIHASESLMS